MNGNSLKSAPEIGPKEREILEERASVDRDDIRRAFAVALMQTAPAEARNLPRFGLGEDAAKASPAGWRPSDVSMTEFGDTVAEAGAGYAAAKPDDKTQTLVTRLSSAVSTAELGKVSFVVDRSNSGLSIAVEVENEAAFRAVDADKKTLLGTLRAAGMTVLSFRIINRGGPGTGLAHRGFVSDAKNPHFTKLGQRRREGDDDDDGSSGGDGSRRYVG